MIEPGVDDLLDDVAAFKFVRRSNRHCDGFGLLQICVEMQMAILVILRQLLSADDRANNGAEGILGAFEKSIQLRFCESKCGVMICCIGGDVGGNDVMCIRGGVSFKET